MNEVARNNIEFGERLKALRIDKGLSMDMLVYDINEKFNIELNKGLVSRWENGINEPSLRYAAYLAQYYDVSLDYLIGLTDCKTPARLLAYANKTSRAYDRPGVEFKAKVATPKEAIDFLNEFSDIKSIKWSKYEP